MAGETDLAKLLATMSPVLFPQTYVYCTVAYRDVPRYQALEPLATYREDEGLTLVLARSDADEAGLELLDLLAREGDALPVLLALRIQERLLELGPRGRVFALIGVAGSEVEQCSERGLQPLALGELRARFGELALPHQPATELEQRFGRGLVIRAGGQRDQQRQH